jgi:TolB-like protein
MTSVVNLDDLYETSGFGRTLTESLATRLFHHGFGIVEVRKSTELLIKNNTGELMLTRDARLIATEYPAAAVVVGTYSLTPKTVIVNVRLLDCVTQEIVSVAGIEIQRTQSINALLAGSHLADTGLSAYER